MFLFFISYNVCTGVAAPSTYKGGIIMKLNNEAAATQALELTKAAIENGFLPEYCDAEDAADAAYTFCKTLYERFTSDAE